MSSQARITEQVITCVSPELKRQILESAERNCRSLSREVEYRLNESYARESKS